MEFESKELLFLLDRNLNFSLFLLPEVISSFQSLGKVYSNDQKFHTSDQYEIFIEKSEKKGEELVKI